MKYAVLAAVFAAAVIWGVRYVIPFTQPALVETHTDERTDVSPYVVMGGEKISVEVVKDDAAIHKGLSGRTSLAMDHGMLFVLPKPDIYHFWMRDMHIPIDIIWIDEGRVVDIEKNVPPEFDPASPRFYTPSRPAQYVLETNAGFAEKNGVKAGDKITFYHIDL